MPDWKHNSNTQGKQLSFNIPEVGSFEELGLSIVIVVCVEISENLKFKAKNI